MGEITFPLHAPELAAGEWIQGPPVSLLFARGAVVLVDFWESTCIHCLRTLPYLAHWHRRYRRQGLVVVGVHTPELAVSTPPVAAAVAAEHGIEYPLLHDPERETWERFANHAWPAKYLVDHRGYLRWEHFGEGAYGETESFLQHLLAEAGAEGPFPAPMAPLRPEDRPGAACRRPSAELHLGYHRGRLLSAEGYRPEETVDHSGAVRGVLRPGCFAARGGWHHGAEALEAACDGAELEVLADAAAIHLVAAPPPAGGGGEADLELTVEVEVATRPGAAASATAEDAAFAPVPPPRRGAALDEDADGRTRARWRRPGVQTLVEARTFGRHHLRLRFPRGARVFAFTFTGCVDTDA